MHARVVLPHTVCGLKTNQLKLPKRYELESKKRLYHTYECDFYTHACVFGTHACNLDRLRFELLYNLHMLNYTSLHAAAAF
jgi:hypothetical protein